MHRTMLAGVLAVAALALAGCSGTGNFDVQQTEPFRVQLEGEPQTVVVSEDDSEAKQVVVATCVDPCKDGSTEPAEVNVKVLVTPSTASACVVKVIIKDKTTGEVLEEREVDAGSGSASSSATGSSSSSSGNGTTTVTQTTSQSVTETQAGSGSQTAVTQNFFVTVKGNHNIVVLTQAIEGEANVDISASHASGQGSIGGSTDAATGSDTGSSTTTASSTSDTYTG